MLETCLDGRWQQPQAAGASDYSLSCMDSSCDPGMAGNDRSWQVVFPAATSIAICCRCQLTYAYEVVHRELQGLDIHVGRQ